MHTSGRAFIDSNIWIYLVDKSDLKRRDCAKKLIKKLLKGRLGVISTQVVQEFYSVSTKKLGVDPITAKRAIAFMDQIEMITVSLPMIYDAIDCSILSKISFWDGLIVVAARQSGCKTIYSEDLSNRQIIAGVRIVNPFKDAVPD